MKKKPDGKVLWLTVLLAACYLLWRRQQVVSKPKPLPKAVKNPFPEHDDEAMAMAFSLMQAGRQATGVDLASPWRDDKTGYVLVEARSGGVIEVIKEDPARAAAKEKTSQIIAKKVEGVHQRFDDIRAQFRTRALQDAADFEVMIAEERERAFNRYRATGLYEKLDDTDLRSLVAGESSLIERIYKPTHERIREATNGTEQR